MSSENADVQKAVELLKQGEVVALPTETVYGLAARIDDPGAIEKIFRTKERPFFDPLIVHVSSISQAQELVQMWGPAAQALAEDFWPGPLTLVLPKKNSVNEMITSGLQSVGLRMPKHPLALQVIQELGVPLAAPSANKFGRTSPTSAEHVRSEFVREKVFVLDGGPCAVGIESTVLLVKESMSGAELSILRKGHVLAADVQRSLQKRSLVFRFAEAVSKKESPGHMKHHYMPKIPLVVCTQANISDTALLSEINRRLQQLPDEVEGVKILKPRQGLTSHAVLKLSADPVVAAREFYSELRRLGEGQAQCLLFYKESHHSSPSWEALMDRMTKAASLIL